MLNGETALSTDFTAQMRQVDLHAGEVFFDVKSDPNRPFSIHTRSGRVDVLGTAFDLRLNRTGLVVTVLESRVRVTDQAGATAVLKPGQQARISLDSAIAIREVNPADERAWTQGKLVFENKPLNQVLSRLDSYIPGGVVAFSPKLATVTVTGVYATDQPHRILETLELTLPVRFYSIPGFVTLALPKEGVF